jgi:hypothetical protein
MRSASAASTSRLERAGRADGAREQVADPELGRRQPVVDARGAEVRALRRQPDVGGNRQAEAAADRGAVDGRDNRLMHPPQRHDHVVEELHRALRDGRARQAGDVRDRPRVLEVGAGAEAVPRPREDDDPRVVVEAHLLERVPQRDHHVEGHGVHALGPVQCHERDVRPGLLDEDERHGNPF